MFARTRFFLIPVAVAVALTILFWWPLFGGAGFVGGDVYPYFFPQKAFYADRLKAGEFPLWNHLVGFGYPVLGESQTGAAYPFHFLFYQLFELNTAYNVEHLLHYWICFVATLLFARRIGLSGAGAYLTALVFTYGWFPPRACLEWAIMTGAWLPVALWCVESFFQTRWWRYAIGTSVALGLQLLAGHYHLAFITQLVVATYICYRLWIEQCRRTTGICLIGGSSVKRAALALFLAGIAGIGLASVQLLPTWELKQRSSRVVTGGDYDPAYGHMPPLYASQLIAPWCWYSQQGIDETNPVRDIAEFLAPWHWFGPHHDLDQALQNCRFGALGNGTNKVEAHAYCGMIPVLMAFVAAIVWFRGNRERSSSERTHTVLQATAGYWMIAGLLALVYATGFLLPIGRHLPGFSFFRGPGRYGIVTTLAIALLAGQCLNWWIPRIASRTVRCLILITIFASTCGDLWLVSRMVKYTYMVTPPISFRESSVVRRLLRDEHEMPRLLAPGPNVGTMLGVSCVPWYLGMAPEEYVDPRFEMPPLVKPLANGKPTPCSTELREWLSRSGVTHVLNFEPLDDVSWQVELVWKGVDPFLNRVWGRPEPIHLYRFRKGSMAVGESPFAGRAYLMDDQTPIAIADWKSASPGSRRALIDAKAGNTDPTTKRSLVLTELAFPGWTIERDGQRVAAKPSGIFQAIEIPDSGGKVEWNYRPSSVFYGATISLVTLFLLAAIAHVRFWHPKFLDRIIGMGGF